MEQNKLIIDVREPEEFAEGHAEGAVNIPLGQIGPGQPRLSSLDKSTKIIVYCRSGNRSQMALQLLQQMGFSNVVNGINADIVSQTHSD